MIPKDRVLITNGSGNNGRIFISESLEPSRGGKGCGEATRGERLEVPALPISV